MKHLKTISALLIGATLLVGCSNNAPASSVSKTVSKSCTTEMQGMKMGVTISAPSEDAEIDSVLIDFEMPFSLIKDLSGMTEISEEEIKAAAEQNEDVYKQTIASQLGIEADSIQSELGEDSIKLSIDLDEMDKLIEVAGLPEDTELIYKDVVESFASQEGLTCE